MYLIKQTSKTFKIKKPPQSLLNIPFGIMNCNLGFDANENFFTEKILGQFFADIFVLHFVMMIAAGARKVY